MREELNKNAAKENINLKLKIKEMDEAKQKSEWERKKEDEAKKELKAKNMMLEAELQEAKKKLKELSGEKADVEKLAEIHLPIKFNKIIDRPLVVKNFNQTMDCYEDPAMGVHCSHVTVKYRGHLESITYRKYRKIKAGKSIIILYEIII